MVVDSIDDIMNALDLTKHLVQSLDGSTKDFVRIPRSIHKRAKPGRNQDSLESLGLYCNAPTTI